MKPFFHILLFIIPFIGAAKNINTDCNTDTCIINLAYKIKYSHPDSAIRLCTQIIESTSKIDSNLHMAYEIMGDAFWHKGKLITSISKYQEGLRFAKKLNVPEKISRGYSNLGYLYMEIGENDKAIFHLNKSIEIAQNNNLEERTIISKVYLAQAWSSNKQYQKAINIQKELIAMRMKSSDSVSIAVLMNNLSNTYTRAGILDSSLVYLQQALFYDEQLKRTKEITNDLMNMSEIYYGLGKYDEALTYINRAIKDIKENKMGDNYLISSYTKLSKIYAKKNDIKNARHYIELTLKMLPVTTNKKLYADIYSQSSDMYKTIGEVDSAYKYLQLYTQMNDSIYMQESAERIAQMEAKMELGAKTKEISILNADKALKEATIEKQKLQRNMLLVIAGLILFFLAFVFNRLKITKKQKEIIEQQKGIVEHAHHELEEKNQEIMDSISYAKRIQSAILPPAKLVKEYLQESFILYKPKDVVAGDFYWMEHKNGKVLFAAADCTGHGVPGAMVSVVCNNALNRSVREHGLTDPGNILDKTREIVIQEFEKSEEDVKDGMDIALCSLKQDNGKWKLEYAGAHNPLWIIRNEKIIETKANKQPIGKFDNPEPYKTHYFDLQIGDSVYVFSDGYVDQFGGEKGKKFKAKAFRELLLSIQHKSMEEQKQVIDEAFETWRGNLEQIDDVCIIGVRI